MSEPGRTPPVRFAHGPGGAVAYQAWGEGESTVLFMTEFSNSVDNIWEHPGRTRLLTFHGTLGRAIRFDPRGQGASDPLPLDQLGSVQAWVDDALLVLEDQGVDAVAVSAEGFATQVAISLAVEHPDWVSRLAPLNPFARLTAAEGHPFGPSAEEASGLVSAVRERWGLGELSAANAPTLAEGVPDPGFLARSERLGASPMVAAALARAASEADIRHLLPELRIPVLVIHTGDLLYVSAEHSRYVAEHIPGAEMIEAPSRSFYWGESGLRRYGEFLSGQPAEPVDHEVASVLFTDIVASTEAAAQLGNERWRQVLDHLDDFVARQVNRLDGRLVKQTGDGHVAVFSRPASAVRAALAILRAAPTLDVTLRAGLHTGDVELRQDGDVAGIAVNVANRVMSNAGAQELLVSRTVADLIAGSGFDLADRGEHRLKGVSGGWKLYQVNTG
jgi:class 3 adenylate cyclase